MANELKPAVPSTIHERLTPRMIGRVIQITVTRYPESNTYGVRSVENGYLTMYTGTLKHYEEDEKQTVVWFDGRPLPVQVGFNSIKDYAVLLF